MFVKGLVSIIMPAYNSQSYIDIAIDSVIAQSYNLWELMIIDDCSTDRTFEICSSRATIDNRIRVLKTKQKSGNPSVPRNLGIKHAKGEYIAFLDSDDVWLCDKLMVQVDFMKQNAYSLIYSSYGFINDEGEGINRVMNVPKSITYPQLLRTCNIGCLTVMYNVGIVGKTYFVPKKCQEDYIYWLSIIKKHGPAYGLGDVLAMYRVRTGSYSNNKILIARRTWDVYRIYEGMNLIQSAYYFLTFFYFWIKKRYFYKI